MQPSLGSGEHQHIIGGGAGMLRQMGGAIGVAIMNIYINYENAFVRANMIPNISAYNEISNDRMSMLSQTFMSSGYDADQAKAASAQLMDNILTKQELLVSYNHGFLFVAFVLLLCVPIVLLIRYNKTQAHTAPALEMH